MGSIGGLGSSPIMPISQVSTAPDSANKVAPVQTVTATQAPSTSSVTQAPESQETAQLVRAAKIGSESGPTVEATTQLGTDLESQPITEPKGFPLTRMDGSTASPAPLTSGYTAYVVLSEQPKATTTRQSQTAPSYEAVTITPESSYASSLTPSAPSSQPTSPTHNTGYASSLSQTSPSSVQASQISHSPSSVTPTHSSPSDSLAPISLPKTYHGEDTRVAWRATFGAEDLKTSDPEEYKRREDFGKNSAQIVTEYFSKDQITEHTLTPKDGKLVTHDGQTASSVSNHSIYAMSPDGKIVSQQSKPFQTVIKDADGNEIQKRNLHHSSMLAGGDVAHAGHIGTDTQGKVNYLDDDSGHYRPDEKHTHNAFQRMAKDKIVDINSTSGRVKLVDKQTRKGLEERDKDGKTIDKTISVHFSGYQQSQGNEKGIRAKADVMKELLAKKSESEKKPSVPLTVVSVEGYESYSQSDAKPVQTSVPQEQVSSDQHSSSSVSATHPSAPVTFVSMEGYESYSRSDAKPLQTPQNPEPSSSAPPEQLSNPVPELKP